MISFTPPNKTDKFGYDLVFCLPVRPTPNLLIEKILNCYNSRFCHQKPMILDKKYKCVSVRFSVSLSPCQTDSVSSASSSLCQFVTLSVCHSASLSLSVRHSVSSLLSQLVSLSVCSFITLSVRIVVRHSVSSSLCQFVAHSNSFLGGFPL